MSEENNLTDTTTAADGAGQPSLSLPRLLITPDWLQARLDHPPLRLLDVRPYAFYTAGHIPGALSLELGALQDPTASVEGMLAPPDRFASEMGGLGIDAQSIVVLCDDNCTPLGDRRATAHGPIARSADCTLHRTAR